MGVRKKRRFAIVSLDPESDSAVLGYLSIGTRQFVAPTKFKAKNDVESLELGVQVDLAKATDCYF